MSLIRRALQDEDTRGKIIGGSVAALELFLLFWLFPRIAWLNGDYTACDQSRWNKYLGHYECEIVGQKNLWDYAPTFLSQDWNLTHATAFLALVLLNVVAACAYGLYSAFGKNVSRWISREQRRHARENKNADRLHV